MQPFTQTRAPRQTRAERRLTERERQMLKPLDPETMKQRFQLPPRGYGESDASPEQKRHLEVLGASDRQLVDSLSQVQAAYLIKFRYALDESTRRQQRALPPAKEHRSGWGIACVCLGAVLLATMGFAFWDQHRMITAPTASSKGDVVAPAEVPPANVLPVAFESAKENTPAQTAPVQREGDAASAAPVVQTSPLPVPVVIAADPRAEFKRAVATSQARALTVHPALGIAGSHLNAAFVFRYNQLHARHDPMLSLPDWPEQLAAECAARLPRNFQ